MKDVDWIHLPRQLALKLSPVRLAGAKQQTFTFRIDDYAKDGGPGQSDFDVVLTVILCATNNFIW